MIRARSQCASLATSLVLSLVAPSLAAASPNDSAFTETLRRQAKARYDDGVVAYRAARYQDAIELFQAADKLLPSAALAYNIARAYEKLHETSKALNFYREYLRREPSAANAPEVRARINELEAVLKVHDLQQLTVISDPSGAGLVIDGQPLGVTPWTGELAPGKHQLSLFREGTRKEVWDVQLPADHALELNVRLLPAAAGAGTKLTPAALPRAQATSTDWNTPLPAPRYTQDSSISADSRRGTSWPVVVAGGVLTLVGLGVGVGFELAAQSEDNKLAGWKESLGPSGCAVTPAPTACGAVADAASRYDRDRALSLAGFATAGVAAVGTIVYWVWSSSSRTTQGSADTPASDVRFGGTLVPRGGALGLSGNF